MNITISEVWRYALYGHLKLSIYFQSPVKLQKICMSNTNNKVYLETISKDINYKLCYLNDFCIRYEDFRSVKTDGILISPEYHIIDTPLVGSEYTEVQKRLANSLNLPQPVSGQHNYHYGIFIREEGEIFQVFEQCTWQERISRQLNYLPVDMALSLREQMAEQGIPVQGSVISHFSISRMMPFLLSKERISNSLSCPFFRHRQNLRKISPHLFRGCCGLPVNITTRPAH
ncbi:Uncharacterised protein [Salmonella enterica subsp. enterica serovar Sanjuan]|uniref:Uncharacterized protein n=1 Tax=Salmonella enterica subsp. enterica serovar Sanjuan TaxID=1160765 RepID=A0A447NJE5_SALET|nr:Uncharacterised protein [Salmonella enterica subsp. enterica serovar Sanjuan]